MGETLRRTKVKYFRLLQNEGCYQYSDSIRFNNDGQITWDTVAAFESQPYSVEFMINPASFSDQVLFSKLLEKEYVIDSVSTVYRHAGIITSIESSKLKIMMYGIGADTTQKLYSGICPSVLSGALPSGKWSHVVVQYTGLAYQPVRLFINGNQMALQADSNSIAEAAIISGFSPLIVGSHNVPNLTLPGKLDGTIKNLRIYSKLMPATEIRQNAFNVCQTPANSSNLLFWSALNNAKDNLVKDMMSMKNGELSGFTWEPFLGVFPEHRLPTTYQYNSLNQVVQQYSPDGDTTQFFFDRLGRLSASQNKEQKENASYSGTAGRFSYTKYDALSRIIEVGEKSDPDSSLHTINLLDTVSVNNWLASGTDRQVTKTIYDEPIALAWQTYNTSRKRVTASVYLENASDAEGDSTLYGYDYNGNVKRVMQHIKALSAIDAANGNKYIDYDYDLVSGKVNMVSYQHGKGDQFYYRYRHDAENRVVSALSSRDKMVWIEDASYQYYLHGPLARTELGQYKVQGVDYAYTLQGWLKGINGDALDPEKEIGRDGFHSSAFHRVSRDVYAYKLGYYASDYVPIDVTNATALHQRTYTDPSTLEATGNSLYNGNISYTTIALSKINSGQTTGYSYGYDQLNRLTEMRQHTATGGWSNSNIITAYKESISYDANGNILTYLRNGNVTTTDMDDLTYKYNRDVNGNIVNNRLNHVRDAVSSGNYSIDIDDQSPDNYTYDKTGNLTGDVAENVTSINWTVYGRIKQVEKNSGEERITYDYNAAGQRTVKTVDANDTTRTTFYIRDVQGNVLSLYSYQEGSSLKWAEQHLYGGNRLGVWQWDTVVPSVPPVTQDWWEDLEDSLFIGNRTYELSNHLGNVLATISDKKIGNDSSGIVNYYLAEVQSQSDYYPFGMGMAERKYVIGNSYKYGFNGKEKESDIKGKENTYDFGDRIFDPQLGRWLSVDMAAKSSPGWTPFRFGFDNPINFKDPNGQWEEDGHFWTVYAMGVALGLNKAEARELAVKAEWYDHVVHKDNSMSIQKIPGKEWMAWGKDGGIGTWADPEWQKTMHGLTGGSQGELLSSVIAKIIGGDLYQLHTLGDAWAHSYVDEAGNRVMYGQHGRNEPWYAELVRYFLGDITFEHAKGGPKHGEHADNIADRPDEYKQYVASLQDVFSQKFHDKIKGNARTDIFEYVQKNGGSKEANIYLLQNFIDLQTGAKSFTTENKSFNEKFEGYLKQMGIKYTASSSTTSTSTYSASGNVPVTTTTTHYNITIDQ